MTLSAKLKLNLDDGDDDERAALPDSDTSERQTFCVPS